MTAFVRHILSLSGGKDSAALAVYMRDNSWFGHFQVDFGNSAQKLVIQVGGKVQQG